ncbi:MAG: hypothetical protein WC980_04130 [Candidatus Brocadiia bacterium]
MRYIGLIVGLAILAGCAAATPAEPAPTGEWIAVFKTRTILYGTNIKEVTYDKHHDFEEILYEDGRSRNGSLTVYFGSSSLSLSLFASDSISKDSVGFTYFIEINDKKFNHKFSNVKWGEEVAAEFKDEGLSLLVTIRPILKKEGGKIKTEEAEAKPPPAEESPMIKLFNEFRVEIDQLAYQGEYETAIEKCEYFLENNTDGNRVIQNKIKSMIRRLKLDIKNREKYK